MRNFPSDAYRQATRDRTVEPVPILEVTLSDGATAFMSDRRFVVAIPSDSGPVDRTYVRRLKAWSGIAWSDDGSIASPTFTLSNIDRVMQVASRQHNFFRAHVSFRIYLPRVYAAGHSFEDSCWTIWSGYCSTTKISKQEFIMNCKDGMYSLSLPFPKRRFMRNCPFEFDDGCECPYSGYGYQQSRNTDGTLNAGDFVQITSQQGVVGFHGETFTPTSHPSANGGASDFDDPPIFAGPAEGREGAAARPGYVDCSKTFDACFERGMQRFFGGLRWIAAWATGVSSRSLLGRIFGTGYDYATVSTPNDTIYNTAVPMLYCAIDQMPVSPLTGVAPVAGFITTPVLFQWRYEDTYTSVEAIVSLGRIGLASDSSGGTVTSPIPAGSQFGGDMADATAGGTQSGIKDVYVNGLSPHNGQYPLTQGASFIYNQTKAVGMGVRRVTGRIGELVFWDQIGGDLAQAAPWVNPITHAVEKQPQIMLSRMAGFFARIFDKNSGLNNPQVYNVLTAIGADNAGRYAGKSAPDVRARVGDGRYVWTYSDGTTRSYAPQANNAWVFLDVYLEALGRKYASVSEHAKIADLQAFSEWGSYCSDIVQNIVNPTVYTSRRYLWSGVFTELQSALDQLDAILKDSYAIRVWRGNQLVVKPLTAGNFASDNRPRPAFQEFVNIIDDDSFEIETPEIRFNQLTLNFADVDFDFQKNSATVYSEAHQVFSADRGTKMELTRSENLTGTPTVDVATRMGARWVKDEIGGVTRDSWARQRLLSLKSTLMMGELELADITYVAHTLVPFGGDWFRIKSIELNDDLSLSFKMRTFYIGNYDDTVIGVSSVELAQFGYNPYIPGSGGQAYAPLPALKWTDEVTPELGAALEVAPLLGIKLHWTPYIDQVPPMATDDAILYDRLSLAVQIYRTPAASLRLGLQTTDTTAYVHYTRNLPSAPFKARINDPAFSVPDSTHFEIVNVTAVDHLNRRLTLERQQEGTSAVHHNVNELLFVRLYPGGFLAENVTHDSTSWLVDTASADFSVGEKYRVDKEIVKITGISTEDAGPPLHATLTHITVARAQKLNDADTTEVAQPAQPHFKIRQLQHVSLLDTTPDTDQVQFSATGIYEYIDPWIPGSITTTTTTTTTESTTTTTTTLFPVRSGTVRVSGSFNVLLLSGNNFGAIQTGHPVYLDGVAYTATYVDATHLTIFPGKAAGDYAYVSEI